MAVRKEAFITGTIVAGTVVIFLFCFLTLQTWPKRHSAFYEHQWDNFFRPNRHAFISVGRWLDGASKGGVLLEGGPPRNWQIVLCVQNERERPFSTCHILSFVFIIFQKGNLLTLHLVSQCLLIWFFSQESHLCPARGPSCNRCSLHLTILLIPSGTPWLFGIYRDFPHTVLAMHQVHSTIDASPPTPECQGHPHCSAQTTDGQQWQPAQQGHCGS